MNFFLNIVGGDWYHNPYKDFSFIGALVLLLALGFIFILSWFLRKKSLSFKITEKQKLGNYIFNFDPIINEDEGDLGLKKTSILTKLTLFFIAFVLIIFPLSQFIKTLSFPFFW